MHNLGSTAASAATGRARLVASLSVVVFPSAASRSSASPGEAQDPQRVIPQAINAVPLRTLLFNVLTCSC